MAKGYLKETLPEYLLEEYNLEMGEKCAKKTNFKTNTI